MLHQDIARKHISNDGVHLSNDGSHMLSDNLVDFIDYFISDSYAFNNIKLYLMKVWTQKAFPQIKNLI